MRPFCDLFGSRYVVMEAENGDAEQVARRVEAMRDIPRLDVGHGKIEEVAKALISEHTLPKNETTDAYHIATAAFYDIDGLLTWNCRHMANPIALQKTIRIVTECGYKCPVIVTPRELVTELAGEYYDDPIVREVHEARYEIMAEFGGDVDAFFDYLVAHPVSGARCVSLKPFQYESIAGD